jgi:hypothetical protein
MPVDPTTSEAKLGGLQTQANPGKKCEALSEKITLKQEGLGRWGAWLKQ